MDAELRERLSWMDAGYEGTPHYDMLMETLNAAGYVLMDRGRAERLIEEARTMQAAYADGGWGESELQPGDLDPLEGGE